MRARQNVNGDHGTLAVAHDGQVCRPLRLHDPLKDGSEPILDSPPPPVGSPIVGDWLRCPSPGKNATMEMIDNIHANVEHVTDTSGQESQTGCNHQCRDRTDHKPRNVELVARTRSDRSDSVQST